jgi:exodeoxyribonuclease VII small subunit
MVENYTYTDAFTELQQIVHDIEIGEVSVDELAEKIKRASQLITVCKAKLTASEEEVDSLLGQLVKGENTESEEDTNSDKQQSEQDEDDFQEFIDEEG